MLHSLAEEFAGSADFAGVYISEAHATDVWPVRSSRFASAPVSIPLARTPEMRASAAAAFARDYALRFPMYCADVGGAFEAVYSPWPIRIYCIRAGVLTFVGEPLRAAPDLEALREHLLSVE